MGQAKSSGEIASLEDRQDMKLAITQMALGSIIVISSIFTSVWYIGYVFPSRVVIEESSELTKHVFINYGQNLYLVEGWAAVLLLLGLAVLGCGVAQFLVSRR
jgi:hypothetical protein